MFLIKCDICGVETKGPLANNAQGITNITDSWNIDGVYHGCRDCMQQINEKVKELKQYYDQQLIKEIKSFITEFKEKKRNE